MNHQLPSLPGVPYPLFEESYALSKLLRFSKPFAAFYSKHRGELGELYFGIDPHMTENAVAPLLSAGDVRYQLVLFKKLPVPSSKAYIAAHELAHCLIFRRGFAGAATFSGNPKNTQQVISLLGPEVEMHAHFINALFHEPLAEYTIRFSSHDFFDIQRSHYRRDARNTLNAIRRAGGRMIREWGVFRYAQFSALGDVLLYSNASPVYQDVLDELERVYPDYAAEGKVLVEILKGFDCYPAAMHPQNARLAMQFVIDRYRLQGLMVE